MPPPVHPLGFDDALVVGAQGVLALAGAWGALLVVAAAVEALSRGRVRALARVGCPASWRPALLAALGAALSVGGLAGGPAHAAPRATDGPESARDLLSVPVRPVDGPGPGGVTAREGTRAVVTVAPGDSLWAIARTHLGDDADDARVLALTEALHRANRAAIGPDPDLLHPGHQLRVPPTPTPREDHLP